MGVRIMVEVKEARQVYEAKLGTLSFTRGKFDDWCVHVDGHYVPRFPKDDWYFMKLQAFKEDMGESVYDDFKTLYSVTRKDVEQDVFDWIKAKSADYPNPHEFEVVFAVLYMTMIAEENKEGAILKKRIKRLGVHQVLVEGMHFKEAANWSRGKPSIVIAKECHARGF